MAAARSRNTPAPTPPGVAATLSFILPGLGQLSVGELRRACLLVVPAGAVFIGAAALGFSERSQALALVLRRDVLIGLLVLNAVLAIYHLAAIVDAYGLARRRRGRARLLGRIVLVGVLAATIGIHGTLEVVGYQAYDTLDAIFQPDDPDDGWSIPTPGFSLEPSVPPTSAPSAALPTPSAAPSNTPTPSEPPRWAQDGRLNVLLIGSDAGPDRWSLRTDTMIVLSIDVASTRAALFGVPRNLLNVPLPPESAGAFPDGRFPGLLNALYVYAMGHPESFPGGDARGFRAVSGAVQELVGVPLDDVVVVNLHGFVRLVDAIGGLWIDVPAPLVDPGYPLEDGTGYIAIDIRPGCQLLDGRMALAYARSRHQDSDYGRMRRQQDVLVALARQVDPIELVTRVQDLLRIARDNLWTTIRRSEVSELAAFAARVDLGRIKTVVFVPPRYPEFLTTLEIHEIRKVVRTAFDGAPASGTQQPRDWPACPKD